MAAGYEALRNGAAYVDLSSRGKLRLTGEDRARLLHAMCTNDVQHLGVHEALYAFFLTAQGRILADAYIYNMGDSLWLDVEPELGPKLLAHLDKYIIADDVEIDDQTTGYAMIGIEGPLFLPVAAQLGIPAPESKTKVAEWRSGFVARAAVTGPDGLRLVLPVSEKQEVLRLLGQQNIPAASAEEAELARIEHGIPRYGQDITERFLVQETGQLHGVHTNKGCYLGQEIVERVRSRGQVHRHLTQIRIASQLPPQPETKLVRDGKEVGEITSAAFSPALGEVVGLAYLRTEAITAKSDLQVGDAVARPL